MNRTLTIVSLFLALNLALPSGTPAQGRQGSSRPTRVRRTHQASGETPLNRSPISRSRGGDGETASSSREERSEPRTTRRTPRRQPQDIFDVLFDQITSGPSQPRPAVPPRVQRINGYDTAPDHRTIQAQLQRRGRQSPFQALSMDSGTRMRGEWAAPEQRRTIAQYATALARAGHYFMGPRQRGVQYVDVTIPETRVGNHRDSVTDMVRLGIRDGRVISARPYTESGLDLQVGLHGGR